jgi:FkbM family methyltransferase
MSVMKNFARKFARKHGYEVRKAPQPGFLAVSVFDLAVQHLMLKRGESLTFIQVGANDGSFSDPLRKYVLRHKWKGILVEPQPDVFDRLKKNYAGLEDRLIFENAAVSSQGTEMVIYRAPGATDDYAPSVASGNPKVVARQLGVNVQDLAKITVPVVRLNDLVLRHKFQDVDLLQIDTEGFDWQVLQTLDLSKTQPRLIQLEHGHLSPDDIDKTVKHLNAAGYHVYFGGYQGDTLAIRGDFLEKY